MCLSEQSKFLNSTRKKYSNVVIVLTPKSPRPFFCKKTHSKLPFLYQRVKNSKIVFFAHLTVGSST